MIWRRGARAARALRTVLARPCLRGRRCGAIIAPPPGSVPGPGGARDAVAAARSAGARPRSVRPVPLGRRGAAAFLGLLSDLPRWAGALAGRLSVALRFPGILAEVMWVQRPVTPPHPAPWRNAPPRRGVRVRRAQLAARAGASRG